MFEPFHPGMVSEMSFLQYHQYIRPNEENKCFKKVATDVFNGKLANRRVDAENRSLVYKGLLIKDIFATLFSYWASINFPKIKIVLLIRNPFSVALSKSKTRNYIWVEDPMTFLNQKNLHEDYLYPFEDLIRKTSSQNDYIVNQILIWSIINYVPLRQFRPNEIQIVFYEQVYNNPKQEISMLFSSIQENYHVDLNEQIIKLPSRFSGAKSNVVQRKSPINSWKNELTVKQIDAGHRVLEEFGFGKLYSNSSMPDRQAFSEIHRQD